MTNIKEASSIVIPTDSKKLNRFIDDAVLAYGNAKVKVHVAAVAALAWAAEHGETSKMNRIYDALTKMDEKEGGKLKRWAGKVSTYTHVYPEGGSKEMTWLGYSTDKNAKGEVKGFFVKTDSIREVNVSALIDGTRFYNTDKPASVDPTLALLLKYLSGIEKTVDKKAEKGVTPVVLPSEIKSALASLTALAAAASATAH